MHPTETCKKVLAVLRKNGHEIPGPDSNWRINRTYAGHYQRSSGAWAWSLEWEGPLEDPVVRGITGQVGGHWPASVCGRKDSVVEMNEFGQVTIRPSAEAIKARL